MGKTSFLLTVLLAGAAACPQTAAADCAQAFYVAELVLPGSLAPTAAVLVRVVTTHQEPKDRRADPLTSLNARLVRDKMADIPLKLEVLGPGLGRLVPERKPALGEWKVVGLVKEQTVIFEGTDTPPPAMPVVLGITRKESTQKRRGHDATHVEVTARIMPAPDGTISVIGYADGDNGRPFLVSPAARTDSSIVLYTSPGRCGGGIPGQSAAAVGQKVRLSLVDRAGRVSPRSPAVEVSK